MEADVKTEAGARACDQERLWEDVQDELISCGPCQTTVAVRGAFPKREIWKWGVLVS